MAVRVRAATILAMSVVLAGAVHAHHSLSMFDTSHPFWVKGTVVSYEAINPHTMIEIVETTADGGTQRWTIEGPFPGRLSRVLAQAGLPEGTSFVKPGDVIEVCGFDLREDLRARRAPRTADDTSPKFAHGQVLVMPNGLMQSWGPYGRMENCMRPDDSPALWADFLNRDELGRGLWCAGHRQVQAVSVPPREFVAAVDGQIEVSCD